MQLIFLLPARIARYVLGTVILFALAAFAAASARAFEIQEVVSPNGIKAWLVETHTTPILSIDFAFRYGAADDPEGKEGLARMVASLLDEGAGELPAQEFRKRLADLSIDFGYSAQQDRFSGFIRTLTQNRGEAMRLFHLSLTEPRFDAEAIARMREQTLIAIRQGKENPRVIAGQLLWSGLFPDHPYGREVIGSETSVSSLTESDFRQFVAQGLSQDRLIVSVAGDITAEELKPLLDQVFGELPKSGAPTSHRYMAPNLSGAVQFQELNVPQATISFAQEGLSRNHPDFLKAFVMNHILGGGSFTSRLTKEVRERRGLTYGISTSLATLDESAILTGSMATDPKNTAAAISLIRDEWQALAAAGPTEEELADAKSYVIGSYALRFDGSADTAEMLTDIQWDQLGRDYVTRRADLINAISREDVQKLAARLLTPRDLTFSVVGKSSPELEALLQIKGNTP